MSRGIVLSLLLIAICAAISSQVAGLDQFREYMHKHHKTYASLAEFQERLENYQASLKRVESLNARSKTAKFAINKFSDMSPEEFSSTVLMKKKIEPSKLNIEEVGVLTPKLTKVPQAFDWRNKGAVTPVKDQGQCGSCWAFSATENIESMWILAGNATASTINLAEQQIVDCDEWMEGCNGGQTGSAYNYIISAGGQESNNDYPYTAEDGTCDFNNKDIKVKISTWKYATSLYNEKTLQQNLVSWGPLSVCVDASNWQDYSSGVMTWEDCAYVNLLDHCVQLVGYQTNSTSGDYWIVRNSWASDWGVDGYIWLQMWSDTCGIAHDATCVVI